MVFLLLRKLLLLWWCRRRWFETWRCDVPAWPAGFAYTGLNSSIGGGVSGDDVGSERGRDGCPCTAAVDTRIATEGESRGCTSMLCWVLRYGSG